jgi:hypothetical protein
MGAFPAQVKGEHSLRRGPLQHRKCGSDKNGPGGAHERLSLVTFFAAAKKVTPPPGRRLLQIRRNNRPHKELNQSARKTTVANGGNVKAAES